MFDDNDTEMLDTQLDEDEEEEDEDEEMAGLNVEEQTQENEEEEEEEDEDEDDEDEEDDEEEEEEEDDDEVDDSDEDEEEDTKDTEIKETEVTKTNTNTESPIEDDKTNSQKSLRQQLIYQLRTLTKFDISPYVAIPYGSLIHSIALSKGPKWLFTGGEDGFIRKYDFVSSIEGSLLLTVLQKHSLVDTMSLAGVITSYWENEQPIDKSELPLGSMLNGSLNVVKRGKKKNIPSMDESLMNTHYEPKLSPTYSLAVQRELLWLVSGLASGGITLHSVRHNEGSIKHYFAHGPGEDQHNDAVDSIVLNYEENKMLTGSWDRKILQWDLNNGKVVNKFWESTSQISSINYRPLGCESIVPIQLQKKTDEDMDSLFGSDEEDNVKVEITKQQNDKVSLNEQRYDDNIFMSSSMDGSINIWDIRELNPNVIRIPVPPSTPPWCMSACWSNDGEFIYAGRRNSTVEEISIKMPFTSHLTHSKLSKVLKFPQVSGPVSVVKLMQNNNHLLCGSYDNIRLYDLRLYDDLKNNPKKLKIPFMIIPGHHGGVLSDLYIDPTCRFMVSASGNRGWNGSSTEMVLIYEINV